MSRRSTRSQAAAQKVEEPQQLSSPPATPAPTKSSRKSGGNAKPKSQTPKSSQSAKKRSRTAVKVEEDPDELPHNLGKAPPTPAVDDDESIKEEGGSPAKKRKTGSKSANAKTPAKLSKDEMEDVADKMGIDTTSGSPNKKSKGEGLDLDGVDPYPEWPHPTAEECWEVYRILDKSEPGNHARPEKVPAPRLDVTGCGEVPRVLDALIRTLLSAATNGRNSRAAFKGLQDAFGVKDGSVDWDVVRRASQPEVEKAIRCGGLSHNKSKSIKGILDEVYEENEQRLTKLKDPNDNPSGAENIGDKDAEISRTENNMLNLDHLHLLNDKEAFKRLTKFKGIGEKTASCVMLFCMQRASFAVDTHVFRLCRWLGWVPPKSWVDEKNGAKAEDPDDGTDDYAESKKNGSSKKATPKKKNKSKMPPVGRNTTFRHCDVTIPGELKYPLHQLLISHGKHCPRCQAITSVHSKDWKRGCPIEKLVKRDGARKGGAAADVDSDEVEEWEEEEED